MKGTRPEWIIVLSRVVEKTAKFNCLQKEWLLQHLKDRGFVKAWMQITWLSDCGPNLRCNRTLAHSCIRFVELHQVHSQHIFALECHGKGELYGKMGDLSRRKHEAATLKMIIDIGGLQRFLKQNIMNAKLLRQLKMKCSSTGYRWFPKLPSSPTFSQPRVSKYPSKIAIVGGFDARIRGKSGS